MSRLFQIAATGCLAASLLTLPLTMKLHGQSCTTCPDNCSEVSNPQEGYYIYGPTDFCRYPLSGCVGNNQYSWNGCCRADYSPILLDVEGQGFELTDVAHGVKFRTTPNAPALRWMSWPSRQSRNAWLAMDRNGDGWINDTTELFGNLTDQPAPPAGMQRNGFRALAVLDQVAYGGNGDGIVDSRDERFFSLRLWRDENHNGVSERGELHRLPELGVGGIELNYQTSERTDQYGNVFRFRAKVLRSDGREHVGRYAWDVFLLLGAPVRP
jgi:hypothetical protein